MKESITMSIVELISNESFISRLKINQEFRRLIDHQNYQSQMANRYIFFHEAIGYIPIANRAKSDTMNMTKKNIGNSGNHRSMIPNQGVISACNCH